MRVRLALAATAVLLLIPQEPSNAQASRSKPMVACDSSVMGLCVEYRAATGLMSAKISKGCSADGFPVASACPAKKNLLGYCEFPEKFSLEGSALKRTFHYFVSTNPHDGFADEKILKADGCAMNNGTWHDP
jgi:hypothetical protein